MSTTSNFSKSSKSSIQQESSEIPPPNFKKRPRSCNVIRCKLCHPSQPNLTKQEIERIKELNKKKTKPRTLKYCRQHCDNSKNYCIKANYYIK